MAEEYKNTSSDYIDLRKGKEFLCPKCNTGVLKPYNTTADKAHSFICSNKNCDGYIHFDPVIDID